MQTRWIKPEHVNEAMKIWRETRSLTTRKSRYERLLEASDRFASKYPYVSTTAAYKDIEFLTISPR